MNLIRVCSEVFYGQLKKLRKGRILISFDNYWVGLLQW